MTKGGHEPVGAEWRRGSGLGAELGEIPAASAGMTELSSRGYGGPFCAGMTEVARWCRVMGVKHIAASLSTPHHARRAAAALTRSVGGEGINSC